MRERGASGVSFDPIVASGPNGAKPHARPSDRQIAPNELVVIDFGCIVDGVLLGHDPHGERRRSRARTRAGSGTRCCSRSSAGRDAVAVGVECAAVDRACRDVIDDAGLG